MELPLRIGRAEGPVTTPEPPLHETFERVTPGVAAFLETVHADGTHAVLDLGPSSASSFRVYGRFARWIRFVDLCASPLLDRNPTSAFEALAANPERPYDLVLAWNVFDRVAPEFRDSLTARLAEITSPDARLFAIAGTGGVGSESLSFSLVSEDRMRCESAPGDRALYPSILPVEMAPLLDPFRVQRAFSSTSGFREYVAVRPGAWTERQTT